MIAFPASATETVDALKAELKRLRISEYVFRRGGAHYRLVVTRKGKEHVVVFAGTPSDRRAPQNAIRDLRRVLGVRPPPRRKTGANARKRRNVTEPTELVASRADTRTTLRERVHRFDYERRKDEIERAHRSWAFEWARAMRLTPRWLS